MEIVFEKVLQPGLFHVEVYGYLVCTEDDPLIYLPEDNNWQTLPIFGKVCSFDGVVQAGMGMVACYYKCTCDISCTLVHIYLTAQPSVNNQHANITEINIIQ